MVSARRDACGQLKEYRWDQQNRLVRFLEGTHESVYEYDGESRRVRIKELTSSVEIKNETFVWCGARICQKRASNGSTVVRRYFGEGFEEGTDDYFYTRDHLGSVREVVESDGTTIASRVSYDPWGKITESGPGALTDFAFTGHYFDRPSGSSLTWWRGYDAGLGRWMSLDPSGIYGGTNLYSYAANAPTDQIDPEDLFPVVPNVPPFFQCKMLCEMSYYLRQPNAGRSLLSSILMAIDVLIFCTAAVGLQFSLRVNCLD